MSEPIITFNNRTLRVEHEGWYFEVKVLASGRQIAVTAYSNPGGNSDMIIRPDTVNRVFISSQASEKENGAPVEGKSAKGAKRT